MVSISQCQRIKMCFLVEAGGSHLPLREFVLFLLIRTHCQILIWALIQKQEQDKIWVLMFVHLLKRITDYNYNVFVLRCHGCSDPSLPSTLHRSPKFLSKSFSRIIEIGSHIIIGRI